LGEGETEESTGVGKTKDQRQKSKDEEYFRYKILIEKIKIRRMKKIIMQSLAIFCLTAGAFAQEITKVGNMSVTAFQAANAKGAKAVNAIKPTSTKLSTADAALLTEIATGGQRQLAISKAIVDKATDPQVKLLANSEIEEQTGLSAKLTEIATAKGATLPSGPDAEAQALVAKASGLTGAEADAFYIKESGIKGHEKLQATMTKVLTKTKDATLRSLPVATLPVIRTHLSVARQVNLKSSYKSVKSTLGY